MKLKSVTTILLMITIIGIGVCNFIHLSQTPATETITSVKELETYFNENFINRFEFINLYGGIQKILGKNEVDQFDIIRDEQGKLHFQYFADGPNDMSEIVNQLQDYRNYLDLIKVNLLFVLPPDKVLRGYTTFSEGLPYSYANEGADDFLNQLSDLGIEYLDLRKSILESGIPTSQLFFNTDHHWTPQAAFWSFGEVVSCLNEKFDYGLDESLTKISQYYFKTYPHFFLGAQGRRTGVLYAGLDDFTVIEPMFKTEYTYDWINQGEQYTLSGPFHGTVLNDWSLDETVTYLDRDCYYAYLGGNFGEATITNHLNEGGVKVLMIKDSYMLPLAAFLSAEVSEIKLIDLRYYKGKNMFEFATAYQPDLVIVSVNPTNLVPEFFKFGEGE